MNTVRSAVLELTKQLMRNPSVTPDDCGCQAILADRLRAAGFVVEALPFGDVSNLLAFHHTPIRGEPMVLFAGHTDVVPTGPVDEWTSDPFEPTERDGHLFGRGAADMKSSLAAMLVATEDFLASATPWNGNIGFLITSDEEGPAIDGTVRVVEVLRQREITPTYTIVGEPSSSTRLGDVIRNGRRGSLNGHLRVLGAQGHVAYPHLADNPLHRAAAPMAALIAQQWDSGDEYYPPTSFQVANWHGGTGASNVIPGTCEIGFNFRFNTCHTAESLQQQVKALLDAHELNYELTWALSGDPFLTRAGRLTRALAAAIQTELGVEAALSTGGGTSDGRFIAKLGGDVVEVGPVNATIHKVDECVRIADLAPLCAIYRRTLSALLTA